MTTEEKIKECITKFSYREKSDSCIKKECADVSAFAMMIWDNLNRRTKNERQISHQPIV